MESNSQLSPGAALIIGLLYIIGGAVLMLGAIGLVPLPLSRGVSAWIGGGVGLLLILGGIAVINGYAIGGGAMNENAPASARSTQNVLAFGICAVLAAIIGWIAFGPGERHFSTSINLPFLSPNGVSGEWIGRAAFGIGTLMVAGMAVAIVVMALRKK